MGDQFFTLSSVELEFPVHFLTRSLAYAEHDEHSAVEWNADSLGESNTIYTCKTGNNLKFKFDSLRFSIHHGRHACTFDAVSLQKDQTYFSASSQADSIYEKGLQTFGFNTDENNKQIQTDVSIQPNVVTSEHLFEKRKIGRPRKKQTSKGIAKTNQRNETKLPRIFKTKINEVATADDHFETANIEVDKQSAEDDIVPGKRKRYSLRGAKLNADIMGAVKGIDSTGEVKDESLVTGTSEMFSQNQNENQGDLVTSDCENQISENDPDYDIEKEQKRHYLVKENNSEFYRSSLSNSKLFKDGILKAERRRKQNSSIECKICKRKLAHYTGVYEHVKKKHSRRKDIGVYLEELNSLKVEKCNICGLTFPDRKKLNLHEDREHTKTAKCYKCDKIFKNLPTLRSHINWMHRQDPEVKHGHCHLCTASFKSASTLKQHIDQVHLGNKYLQCDICEKKFYNNSQLNRHSRIHNMDESQKSECQICGKRFAFAHNMRKHMKVVHSAHKESFHCPYCGKGFGQKAGMVSHIQLVHFNIFSYPCKECKATFARAVMLTEHMKSYHKQTDFQVKEKAVKNGIYNKTAEDMFYCSYCKDGFLHKTKLIEHMHSDHSEAFPFRCDTCNQGFLERSFIVMHKMKAHGILMVDQPEESFESENDKRNEILQIISAREGHPSKIIHIDSNDSAEQVTVEEQAVILQQAPDDVSDLEAPGSSLLIEVASGSSTCRYVIEAPEILRESGSVMVAQDIANLLFAAEQSMQEGEEVSTTTDGTTEISVVIDGEQAQFVTDGSCVGQTTETGGVSYIEDIALGDPSNLQIQIQGTEGEVEVVTVPEGESKMILTSDSSDLNFLQLAAMPSKTE